jgi:hypothetical protein
MKSGAWCKSIQSGAALGGITASILNFYSGNSGAKFSKKTKTALWRGSLGLVRLGYPSGRDCGCALS